MKRTLALFVILVMPLSLAWTVSAGAATKAKPKVNPHATYALGKAKKCRTDFVKKTEKHEVRGKGVRYVACVYRAPTKKTVTPVINPAPVSAPTSQTVTPTTVAPTPSYSYSSHVDPSFVQSPSNPMDVTYTFTADATETLGAAQFDTDQQGTLPGGILDLTSDGSLACSINVGGATDGGNCFVPYTSFGTHQVITEYFPNGTTPVTETDHPDIEPFSTSVSISTPFLGSTVDVNEFAYQVVSIPVTVSGLTQSLGTSGTISLTNTDVTGESCQPLTYSAQFGSASSTCTAEVEDDPTVATSWTPTVTFTGDTDYSSSGATGTVVAIPAAPAPTVDDVTVTLQCDESGGFCTEYQSAPETTDARTNVFAGNPSFDETPGVGTVTFTSADDLPICSAAVGSTVFGPDSAGRCVGQGGPFEGPIHVSYSGGTVEMGDTVETVYSSATTVGGSN